MFCGICGNKCSDEFRFCPCCGRAVASGCASGAGKVTVAAARASSLETPKENAEARVEKADTPMVQQPDSLANIGTIVFGGFCALSVLVSLVRGVVPIYLAEAVLWGGLAWYWHKRKPRSAAATGTVLVLAIVMVAGEGFLVGRQSFGNTYASRNKPTTRIDPELLNSLRGGKLATLTPATLVENCGAPIEEFDDTVATQNMGALPSRKIVYRTVDGLDLTFSFESLDEGVSWDLVNIADNSARDYSYADDTDVSRVWAMLPCLGH